MHVGGRVAGWVWVGMGEYGWVCVRVWMDCPVVFSLAWPLSESREGNDACPITAAHVVWCLKHALGNSSCAGLASC